MADRFKKAPVLTSVRGVGFDNTMRLDGPDEETLFFISAGGKQSRKATHEAIREGIQYLQNQVDVMRDYLANGCNPNTHEWTKRSGKREHLMHTAEQRGPVMTMNHYQMQEIGSIEEVRNLFKDMLEEDWTMNWLFLSTSGVHGSYWTLDELEKDWDTMEEDTYRHSIIMLVVLPRICLMAYGEVEIEREDILWLRVAVERTLQGVRASQEGNLPLPIKDKDHASD